MINEGRLGLLLLAVAVSLTVAVVARLRGSSNAVDFQLAGRSFGVITNATAICGDYVSAASFLGVAASVYASGLDGGWQAVGFAAGFVPVTLLVAAPLRRFGDRSLSDFLGRRVDSEAVRLVAVAVVELIILIYLIPQAIGGGLAWQLLIDASLPGLDAYESGIFVSTLVIGVLVTVGGMRGTTWNQALQFVVLMCVLVWIALMLVSRGISYGDALSEASAVELLEPVASTDVAGGETLAPVPNRLASGESARFDQPGARFSAVEQVSLLITLTLGTAGLPHVMNRFFTAPSGRAARKTSVWVLVFVGLFYSLAVFAGTASRPVIAAESQRHEWLAEHTVDGVLKVPEYALLVLGRLYGGVTGLSVVATGAMIAVMSTVGGLLLAASTSWGYDVYERHVNRRATRRQALRAGQAAVVILALIAALLAAVLRPDRVETSVPSVIAGLVTTAFALAASTLTPALVLAIWWKRLTAPGALAGLAIGTISVTVLALLGMLNADAPALFRVPALITAPLSAATMIVVSWLTEPPAGISSIWVRMHGGAQDRRSERLARLVVDQP